MRKEDMKRWTWNMLKEKILYLDALAEQRKKDMQEIYERAKVLAEENENLQVKNKSLNQSLKTMDEKLAQEKKEYFFLKRNYEEAKELIELLEEKLSQYEKVEIKATNYPEWSECECDGEDDIDDKSDIISQLQTTIDVLVDRYVALRKSEGMD